MKIEKLVIFIILILMFTPQIQASVIPGRWEKVESLEAGFPIVISLISGENLECRYQSSGQEALDVIDLDNNSRTLQKSQILTITGSEKIGDSLANGALIGAAVGFGTGFLGFAAANNAATSGPWWDGEAAAYATCLGLVGAGIGLLVGSGVDGAVRNRELLYEAD